MRRFNDSAAKTELSKQTMSVFGYHNRAFKVISRDMQKLWAESPDNAIKFIFALRTIIRRSIFNSKRVTKEVSNGCGLRDESIARLAWLVNIYPDIFYKNIAILPIVGSWKDIWRLLVFCHNNFVNIDASVLFTLMEYGLKDAFHGELVKKYMPRIKSKKPSHKCRPNSFE